MATYCSCGCGAVVADGKKWKPGHWARSVESRAQSSERWKGKSPWNKGIPRTDQEKENIRSAILKSSDKLSEQKKREHAEGVYDFMRTDANVSKRPEVAAKIGQANARREVTAVTKEKIRAARTGKPGHEMSETRKRVYSERMKRDNPMFRKEVFENHPLRKCGRGFISLGENKVAAVLDSLSITYERQAVRKVNRSYYALDFYLPSTNQCIEFDGHRSHAEHPERDKQRDIKLFTVYKIRTLRILPSQLNNRNREALLALIQEFHGNAIPQNSLNQASHPDSEGSRPYRRRKP